MDKSASYIELLCRCLNAQTPNELDKHFTEFYQYLVGTLNFLTKNTKYNSIAEDVLQDILTEMLVYLKKRPELALKIKTILLQLNLNSRQDIVLTRNINDWKNEISSWVNQIMGFTPDFNHTLAADATKEAKELNEALLPIQRTGFELVSKVYNESNDNNLIEHTDENNQKFEDMDREIKNIFKDLTMKKQQFDSVELDKELGGKGSVIFIEKAEDIWKSVPSLRFPFLNYIKIRALNKISSITNLHYYTKRDTIILTHDPDDSTDQEGDAFDRLHPDKISSHSKFVAEYSKQCNPTEQPEAFLADDIIQLLSVPITNAKNNLEKAKNAQEKSRAQQKINKEEENFIQHKDILIYKYSGFTQQETAEKLNLTRDQIRGRWDKILHLLAPLNLQTKESQQ